MVCNKICLNQKSMYFFFFFVGNKYKYIKLLLHLNLACIYRPTKKASLAQDFDTDTFIFVCTELNVNSIQQMS